jgi:hypothetical protein
LCVAFFLFTLTAAAQSPVRSIEEEMPGSCAIWGQVVTPGLSPQEHTSIEVVGKNGVASQKVSVINQRRNFDEAFDYLQQAAIEFPLTRLLAANAFFRNWMASGGRESSKDIFDLIG